MAKDKGRGGGFGKALVVILIIAVIILAILYFLDGKGLGFLGGSGGSDSQKDSGTGSAVERAMPEQEDAETVNVTVSGEKYLVGGVEQADLDSAMAQITAGGENINVIITDDSAVEDTMTALTKALSDRNIGYTVETGGEDEE